jgi:diguanylate cyclase (GGDEF)-like protein
MVVLTEVSSLADAHGPAAKLVEAISEPIFINDLTLQLSTSIGISMYPDDAENVTDLISIADYALYEAKRGGKNRFCANGSAARQAAQAVKPQVPAVTPSPASAPELAQHR